MEDPEESKKRLEAHVKRISNVVVTEGPVPSAELELNNMVRSVQYAVSLVYSDTCTLYLYREYSSILFSYNVLIYVPVHAVRVALDGDDAHDSRPQQQRCRNKSAHRRGTGAYAQLGRCYRLCSICYFDTRIRNHAKRVATPVCAL